MQKYDYLIFIGRFQPVHLGHIAMMREALRRAGKLMVLLGAAGSARRMRNPWYEEERAAMIRAALDDCENARVLIGAVADFPEDRDWVEGVRAEVARLLAQDGKTQVSIAVFGHFKDETSYYLKLFPEWDLVDVDSVGDYNATAIRKAYFQEDGTAGFAHPHVPQGVAAWLDDFRASPAFAWLMAGQRSITAHQALWKDAPYPVIFVTTDAVVFHRSHVLMIRRKHHPGKDLWALPGGYLEADETLLTGCLRELREETGLHVQDIEAYLSGSAVFDNPKRSDRGRIITHAFAFRLPDEMAQPVVKGGDDAAQACWLAADALNGRDCFDDHYAIVHSWRKKMGKI